MFAASTWNFKPDKHFGQFFFLFLFFSANGELSPQTAKIIKNRYQCSHIFLSVNVFVFCLTFLDLANARKRGGNSSLLSPPQWFLLPWGP